ncbi:hypothetical protein QWZ02_06995 [Kinneretia asaccharophila]|uniref:NlpB/DapX lipoprotein n=1 Tax=Roseateles asaccharophilus TaxID=582607 RepID=A0A4R6N3A1_9BURK|nr:hypothetical protein [Roseateles asaccharophilus]MDN3544192.1 hypothetical protein [Roseateles asaccharophilus]TDP09215.1 hypothetical protein DFR39_10551 [Roseateles asaccharophilus]
MSSAAKPAAILALALAMQACSDGYPAEDLPPLSPFDMSNLQRLTALNQLGATAHRDRQWSFEQVSGCRLELQYKRKGVRAVKQAIELERSIRLDVAFDEPDGTFDVHVMAGDEPNAPPVATLLESAKWTHAVQAELLLQLLARDCEPA